MKRHFLTTLLALFGLASGAACEKTPIEAEPGAGGSGAKGGAGGQGAADAGPPKTSCPKELPGPLLVPLPGPNGKFYCMDQRETTWSEYETFAKAKGSDVSGQPKYCAWNKSYMPTLREPGNDSPMLVECRQETYKAMLADGSLPAYCVDFCDAWAYCTSVGKRLCREADSPDPSEPLQVTFEQQKQHAKSLNSEWTNACTQGGKTKYAYGDTLEADKCIDKAWLDAKKSLSITNLQSRTCHGTIPPFNHLFDLDGSVSEWVDSCDGTNCAVRGASPFIVPPPHDCRVTRLSRREYQGPGKSIRCCADAVAPSK